MSCAPRSSCSSIFGHPRLVTCLASLFLIWAIPAAADPHRSSVELPAEDEPITPVPQPPPADPLKLAIGELVFADPRLSSDGSRACSSCHDIGTNGADTNQHDKAFDGSELLLNTPTVFNAALSFRLNWEGNFRTLEAEDEATLITGKTMGKGFDDALLRLSADPKMS